MNLYESQPSKMEGPPSAARHTDENVVHTSLKPSTASTAPLSKAHNPFAAVKQQQQASDENEIEHCPPGDPLPAAATAEDADLDVYSSESYVRSTAAFVRAEDMASELRLPVVPSKHTEWRHGQAKVATFGYLSKLPVVPGAVDRKGSLASSGRSSFADESTTDELFCRSSATFPSSTGAAGEALASRGAQSSAESAESKGATAGSGIDMGFS